MLARKSSQLITQLGSRQVVVRLVPVDSALVTGAAAARMSDAIDELV